MVPGVERSGQLQGRLGNRERGAGRCKVSLLGKGSRDERDQENDNSNQRIPAESEVSMDLRMEMFSGQ